MSIRSLCSAVLVVTLVACGSTDPDSAPAASGSARVSVVETEQDAAVDCAAFYSAAREAVLGTLQGTEHLGLIQPATALSTGVLAPLPEGDAPQSYDCSASQRRLLGARVPDSTPARALASPCALLIERIDTTCLLPLANRGEPLSGPCNITLVGLSDSREGLDRKLGDGGYCESMARGL